MLYSIELPTSAASSMLAHINHPIATAYGMSMTVCCHQPQQRRTIGMSNVLPRCVLTACALVAPAIDVCASSWCLATNSATMRHALDAGATPEVGQVFRSTSQSAGSTAVLVAHPLRALALRPFQRSHLMQSGGLGWMLRRCTTPRLHGAS